jgi:hypothetical protein
MVPTSVSGLSHTFCSVLPSAEPRDCLFGDGSLACRLVGVLSPFSNSLHVTLTDGAAADPEARGTGQARANVGDFD